MLKVKLHRELFNNEINTVSISHYISLNKHSTTENTVVVFDLSYIKAESLSEFRLHLRFIDANKHCLLIF